MLEDCRNRLAALGINAPKFDMNADEADDRLKAIQNKLRFISLYEKSRRQPKEIRLLRFLCYGDETPLYQPGSRMQPNRLAKYRSEVVDEYLQEIENEREKVLQAGCPKMPTVVTNVNLKAKWLVNNLFIYCRKNCHCLRPSRLL